MASSPHMMGSIPRHPGGDDAHINGKMPFRKSRWAPGREGREYLPGCRGRLPGAWDEGVPAEEVRETRECLVVLGVAHTGVPIWLMHGMDELRLDEVEMV